MWWSLTDHPWRLLESGGDPTFLWTRLNIPEAESKQHPSRRKVTECKRSGDGLPSGQRPMQGPRHMTALRCQNLKGEKKLGSWKASSSWARKDHFRFPFDRDDFSMPGAWSQSLRSGCDANLPDYPEVGHELITPEAIVLQAGTLTPVIIWMWER
jgi:hypothetical protein